MLEQQALAAARFVEDLFADRPGMPVVLLGDLDVEPDQARSRFGAGRQSPGEMSVRYDTGKAIHPDEPGHTFDPDNR